MENTTNTEDYGWYNVDATATDDHYGSLLVADLDGDSLDELAIGLPGAKLNRA